MFIKIIQLKDLLQNSIHINVVIFSKLNTLINMLSLCFGGTTLDYLAYSFITNWTPAVKSGS